MGLIIASTTSDAGKTMMTAVLSRLLGGFPMKFQNMSLNSYATSEGGEIAFSQAMQSMGIGMRPSIRNNPVLLKFMGIGVEVILNGRSLGILEVNDYYAVLPDIWKSIDVSIPPTAIVEGAGGVGEPNFLNRDISVVAPALKFGLPIILVLDIDRGGSFASAYGTFMMLPPSLRSKLKGFIINKFRGKHSILDPAVRWLEERTGMKHLGTVQMLEETVIPQEDSMDIRGMAGRGERRVTVVAYPYMSNFDEFYAFKFSNASVEFVTTPAGLKGSDMVILPGSRNTYESMVWMRERGFLGELDKYNVLGICGGYQLMNRALRDPYGMEAGSPITFHGLSMFSGEVVFGIEKLVSITKGKYGSHEIEGYEIRRGRVRSDRYAINITSRNSVEVEDWDGEEGKDGRTFGTSIHGFLYSEAGREVARKFGIQLYTKTEGETYYELIGELANRLRGQIYVDEIEELFNDYSD